MSARTPWQPKGNLENHFPGGFSASAHKRETVLDYAMLYTSLGWAVIPLHHIAHGRCSCGNPDCRSPGKHPRTPNGLSDATLDETTIRSWWSAWPDANIAIATGTASGFWALDVDPRNGGDTSLEALESAVGGWPDTVEQLTGGGGRHLVFVYPPNVRIRSGNNKLGPGLDVKSDGGYIVVEPSNHISGTNYVWEGSSDPLEGAHPAPTPSELLTKLAERPEPVSGVDHSEAVRLAPAKVAEIRSALTVVSADDYERWLQIGMALHSTGAGQQAFGLWSEWSQLSDKYDSSVQAKKWASFGRQQGVTLSTLFGFAKHSGWIDPHLPTQLPPLPAAAPVPDGLPSRFQLLTVQDILEQPPPTWRVSRLLPMRGVAMVWGASGAGKTFVALDLCSCTVRGEPWFGRRTKATRVIYIAAEGNLRLRLEACLEYHGLPVKALDGLLIIQSAINLLNPNADLPELLHALDAAVAAGGEVGVIVIDTLNRAMPGGKENASEDVGLVLSAARLIEERYACLVLFIHHAGKDESRGSRGHSSLKAAMDAELLIQRDGDIRSLRADKVRDDRDGEVFGMFRLKSVQLGPVSLDDPDANPSEMYSSCVVDPLPEFDGTQPSELQPQDRRALEVLRGKLLEYGERLKAQGRNPLEATIEWRNWKEDTKELQIWSGGHPVFSRLSGRLEAAGLVVRNGPFVALVTPK